MSVEQWARIAGAVLQLAGVVMVLRGISATRRELGIDSVLAAGWRRFRTTLGADVPYPKRQEKGDRLNLTVRKRHSLPFGWSSSVDPQILRSRLDDLTKRVDQMEAQAFQSLSDYSRQLERHLLAIRRELVALKGTVTKLAAGNLRLELLGVALVVFGTALESLSPEIAGILS